MFLSRYAHVCFVLSIVKINAKEITYQHKFLAALDLFENSKQELCDNHFTSGKFFYCKHCLPYTTANFEEQIPCNFLIRIENKKKFRLTVRVDGGPKPFEIKVMDGLEEGYNVVDKVLTDRDGALFESTGDMMAVRVDNRRANMSLLQFGFHVVPQEDAVGTYYGCSFVYEAPKTIQPPYDVPDGTKIGECYWKILSSQSSNKKMLLHLPPCPPGDTSKCYLNYIRVFAGSGVTKSRKDRLLTRTTVTKYEISEKSFSLEYYGCPVEKAISINVEQ
ncbi:hypothetical protein FGIG_02775 [Fasciola gigantica]|uniref:Uncharacterized protein n=1 Tax=Fasciola gigantica TaxID=46835 RepID=A0A504ZBG5_FASGI|nr:hypothetical protein FGIG_02775 [Fasciola gigantica]